MSLTLFFGVLHYGSRVLKHVVDTSDFVLKRFVTSKAVTYTVDKFADPQDFEEEFGRLIGALKQTRLLVVFDNLDRVTHKRAVEVLTTIKTFLEPKDLEIKEKEVVFVIPCDADAIREHISSVYSVRDSEDNSAFSRDEFLKKFFNAILWIPEFIPTELEAYTREMLRKTKVKDLDNDKVAWLITKAYRENPRQIKQFINILLANYLLVKERQGGEGKDFPEEFLETNIPQLTKFLLLYQCYPKDVETLRESRIASLQDAITQGLKFSEGFKSFVNETAANSPISDVGIFFTLRISEQEKKLPGVEDFFINLEDGKIAEAESYFDRLKHFDDVQETVSQVIEGKVGNITNELSLASFISTLLTALDNKKLRLNEIAYGEIVQKLTQNAVQYFDTVSPTILANQIAEPLQQHRNDIVQQWHRLLTDLNQEQPQLQISEEYWIDLFFVIFNHGAWFDSLKDEIKEILSKRFVPGLWVARLLKGKAQEQVKFIDGRFSTNLINSLNQAEVESESFRERLELIFDLDKKVLNADSYQALVNRVTDLLESGSTEPLDAENEEHKMIILDTAEEILEHFKRELKTNISDPNSWQNLATHLTNGINQVSDWTARKIYFPLCLRLMHFVGDPKIGELRQFIENFINKSAPDGIEYILDVIDEPEKFIEESEFNAVFEERALGNQQLFNLLFKYVSDEKKTDWLLKLVERDLNRAIDKLKDESYQVPDRAAISQALLDIIESKPANEQSLIFESLNAIKCSGESRQKDQYVSVLKKHLTNVDTAMQEVAFTALSGENFLGKTRIRPLTKDIFDWLRTAEVSEKYQPFSIRAVLRGHEDLNPEEINELLQFIFDEIIRKKTDPGVISFGFDQLLSLRPKYEARKDNFEDIRQRIETEEDVSTRQALIQGLKRLKPERLNKSNRDFWTWVEGLE